MDIESGSKGGAGGGARRKSKMPLLKFPLPGEGPGWAGLRVHTMDVSGARGVCRGLEPGAGAGGSHQLPRPSVIYIPQRWSGHKEARETAGV